MIVAHGGSVIAQDEATSVVWGMPGSAANAGLCSAVLPSLKLDTKRAGDRPRWILAHGVGAAEIHADVPESLVIRAVDFALSAN